MMVPGRLIRMRSDQSLVKMTWQDRSFQMERRLGRCYCIIVNLMHTFQSCYGKALRENKGDLPNIQKAAKAVWHHYVSIEDNQMHDFCPEGTDSSCKWQKDQANGTTSFKPKNVAPAVMQEILPTFEGLWAENLLEG